MTIANPNHFQMSFPLPIPTGSRDPQWLMLVRNMTKINSIQKNWISPKTEERKKFESVARLTKKVV
jgi:hypothetical protein